MYASLAVCAHVRVCVWRDLILCDFLFLENFDRVSFEVDEKGIFA